MDDEALKRQVAQAALKFIEDDMIIGVGTGSTVNYFIEELASIKHRIEAAVASSETTAQRLRGYGIPVLELNSVGTLNIYIDGADEFNSHFQLIKGGGGALTREKIIASAAKQFICMVQARKKVDVLGQFPLPVEVIPMARSYVGRQLVKLGGDPIYREQVITDNGNIILDVHNLSILEPLKLEMEINNIAGVVENGIFAKRPADRLLISSADGVKELVA